MTDQTGDDKQPDEDVRRGLLDSIIPDLVRKAITQGVEALNEDKLRETVVAELFRKAVNKGGSVVDTLQDMPLPKEVVDRVTGRVDDYKSELFSAVRTEVADFLDRIDLGHELQKMLTSLSFEITTEVRFIPNEKGVKPDIKARARVKRTRGKRAEGKGESSKAPAEAPGVPDADTGDAS
jgi:hypothetical protein